MVVVPFPLVPMAPTLARLPFHRDGWVYEEKIDGWRMLAYKDGASVRLISRNAVDWTSRFRELVAAIAKLRPHVLVLDGEIAVFDKKFVSRFELLCDPDPAVLCTPPMFIVFDVLPIGRQDVRRRPLERRRPLLEEAIAGADVVLPVRRLDANGARAWKTVERRGLEGFVAKDPTAPYVSGRTARWMKVKQRDYRVEERGFHRGAGSDRTIGCAE
jgi:bifunctional non-homologous end joining protein LigD